MSHQHLIYKLNEYGASERAHSGRNFIDHLIGTFELLKRWGAAETAQNAGLFHSIYGTEYFFFENSRIQRKEIQGLIGVESENLVFAFCRTPRESIIEDMLLLYSNQLVERNGANKFNSNFQKQICQIFFANYFEQTLFRAIKNRKINELYCSLFFAIRPFDSDIAYAEVAKEILHHVS